MTQKTHTSLHGTTRWRRKHTHHCTELQDDTENTHTHHCTELQDDTENTHITAQNYKMTQKTHTSLHRTTRWYRKHTHTSLHRTTRWYRKHTHHCTELQDDTENTTNSPFGTLSTTKLIYEYLRINSEKLRTQSDLEKLMKILGQTHAKFKTCKEMH